MAEAVCRHLAAARGMDVVVDGAGVAAYHIGERPHRLTLKTLADHGVTPPGVARQVRSQDFEDFDHIVAMDRGHRAELLAWPGADPEKVTLLHDWSPAEVPADVPDPYYGPPSEYETVYRLVTAGSNAILDRIKSGELPGRSR